MGGIWVNIYDVLDAQKTGETVLRFPNLRALADYSYEDKIFPKQKAKGGALKFVLKELSKGRRARGGVSLEHAFGVMSI